VCVRMRVCVCDSRAQEQRITIRNLQEIVMHTADANAAALPPNAHSGTCNPIGAGSLCAAMSDKKIYPNKSYAECCRRRIAIQAQNSSQPKTNFHQQILEFG